MTACTRRGGERAAERFVATARRLPTPDTLLAVPRQRLDDLAERLPRGLAHRLAVARGELARAGGALRPGLLGARLARGGEALRIADRDLGRAALLPIANATRKLDRVALRPTLVTTRLADARARLDGMWRIASGLNPENVLKRGYARVEKAGHVVASADAARAAGTMRLVFADGGVDVTTAAPTRTKGKPAEQPLLL